VKHMVYSSCFWWTFYFSESGISKGSKLKIWVSVGSI